LQHRTQIYNFSANDCKKVLQFLLGFAEALFQTTKSCMYL
jgi:hypothetical protein